VICIQETGQSCRCCGIAPMIKTVSVQELSEQLEADPQSVLIDIRRPLEFDLEHVPQARNIPLAQCRWLQILAEWSREAEGKPIYFICRLEAARSSCSMNWCRLDSMRAVCCRRDDRLAGHGVTGRKQTRVGDADSRLLESYRGGFCSCYWAVVWGFLYTADSLRSRW